MAEFARLWTSFTGRRVIGLTTSTNAARVLAARGPGRELQHRRIPRQDRRLRRAAPARPAAPGRRARAGRGQPAQHHRPGHDRGSSPAGRGADHRHRRHRAARRGRSRGHVPPAGPARSPPRELHEVRRFDAQWEREASVRLRDGDLAAVAAYDRHGRIRGADEEAAYDRAASMWLADHLRGKDVLLLAGSNAEAAELSRRVQARLIQLGTVGPPQAALSDGNHAGVGDLVRARLNTEIDAGGRQLTNRDTLEGHRPARAGRRGAAAAAGRDLDRAVPGPPVLPRTQRRARLRRQRPRRPGPHRRHRPPPRHRLPVPAGPVRRHDPRPGSQHRARGHRQDRAARARAVPAGRPRIRARQRHAARRRRPVRHRADPPGPGMGRGNRPPAPPVVRGHPASPVPGHRRADQGQAHRDPKHGGTSGSTPGRCCSTQLRDAQLAGHDIGEIIDRITAAPMDGARSISSVLHDRLQRLHLPEQGHERDVGAADTAERPGAGARAGRRARRPAPGTRRSRRSRTPNRG